MYRLLIADDEPIERMVVCKTIQQHFKGQLEIIQATNGREALKLFKEKNCQIAILDVEMPGINGLEAAEGIRREDKNCSIIFLTAFEYFTYAKRAITVRALEYLLKPVAEEELVAVIEEAMQITDATEEKENQKDEVYDEDNLMDGEKIEQLRMSMVQERILEFIKLHYTEDISLQDVAREMNYSDAYFCKLFKQCFDKNFITYLAEFRIEKAKLLLLDVTINVKEVSDQVGYRDSNYFAKVFKRIEGLTPSEYRIKGLGSKINSAI